MSQARPGWREPMVWLMAGIPLATIVAGLLTLRIASDRPLDAAPETVRRTAQAQTTDLAADAEAARMGLSARLRLAADGTITLDTDNPGSDSLQVTDSTLALHFVHPTSARGDVEVPLQRTGDGWRGHATADPRLAWSLRLGDAQGRWRLVAKLAPGQREARLVPALEPAPGSP